MISPGDWSRDLAVIAEWLPRDRVDGLRFALVRVLNRKGFTRLMSHAFGKEAIESTVNAVLKQYRGSAIFFLISLFLDKKQGPPEGKVYDVLLELYVSRDLRLSGIRHGHVAPGGFDRTWEKRDLSVDLDLLPEDLFPYLIEVSSFQILGLPREIPWVLKYRSEGSTAPDGSRDMVLDWVHFVPPDVEPIDVEAYLLLGTPTPWVWPHEEFMAWYTDQARGGSL